MRFGIIYVLIAFGCIMTALGQEPNEKVELVQAGTLEGSEGSQAYVKLKDHVIFKQGDMTLYCDSAFQYPATNFVKAFGKVRLIQGDTLSLTCNRLEYDGNTKQAKAIGNVLLIDKQMTLKTEELQYDRQSKVVSYHTGAFITDNDNILKSKIGNYNTAAKVFIFKKNVSIENYKKGFSLLADSLHYNTLTRLATFKGETVITTADGKIKSSEGAYNTSTMVMYFKGKAQVFSGDNVISGDRIDYNEKSEVGLVSGDIQITNTKDSITVLGQHAMYSGKRGYSVVYGAPLMYKVADEDTLFIKADTLVSINDTINKIKVLKAYFNVEIFRNDLQGKCDSLVYNFADSTIYFYRNPILWNGVNQLVADSIWLIQKNGKLHTMHMHDNAFIISRDTLKNFNQVKGRTVTGTFQNGHLQKVVVEGNAESIYHALEGDTKLIGMNKVECGSIVILFKEDKLTGITFVNKPDATFFPPKEIKPENQRLKGFRWRQNERPNRKKIGGKYL